MLKAHHLFFLLVLISSMGHAQSSREFRSNHSVGLDLVASPASLPFPGSKGVAINFNLSPNWQIGVDYMSTGLEVNFSKLNLAGFNEKNIGIKARRFYGNSFNLSFGYVRRTNEVYLDPSVYGFSVSDINFRTEAYTDMLHLGMAHHWQFDNLSLAVNWLTLNLPLNGEVTQSAASQTDDEEDKDDIRRAENVLTWYPNVAIFTLSAGYMF
ncbi:MAG: hypothetical protein V7785_09390 [Bermanella sp.]